MMQDKLAIYIITYNRKKYLQRTFEQILAEDSPIKDFDITVLDNASTDGTSELIDEYCIKFPNIKHVRHKINIGGNANIVRAYELGATSEKDYVWVLCDDDNYDFSNWSEVEKLIKNNVDAICIANYVYPTQEKKKNLAYQIFQMTFVPANIFKVSNITDTVLTNMYDTIYTMFAQSCITISLVNSHKNIHVLSKPIVFNGLNCEDKCESIEYTRGADIDSVLPRKKEQSWIIGFSNIIGLINDNKLKEECINVAILYEDIYSCKKDFFNYLITLRKDKNLYHYYLEIFKNMGNNLKKSLVIYTFIREIKTFIQNLFSIKNSTDKKYKVLTILGIKFFKLYNNIM